MKWLYDYKIQIRCVHVSVSQEEEEEEDANDEEPGVLSIFATTAHFVYFQPPLTSLA